MKNKELDRATGTGAVQKAAKVPEKLAVWLRRSGALMLALVLAAFTLACDDATPGLTAEEMQSDPLPEFDDSAFVGVWISDGEYVSFERVEHGNYLLRPPEKEDSEPEESIPFRLKRAGNLLIMEYWMEADGLKIYRPCWVGIEEAAMELHCLVGNKLPEFGIEFEVHKSGDENIQLIRASQERLKQLYQEQANNDKVFEKTMRMTRPQPERVARLRKRASNGNAAAQEQLARVYLAGEITAKDNDEAQKWARKAAESGRASGQVLYGDLLANKGSQNQEEAERGGLNHEALLWYQRAAEQKYGEAYSRMGHLYANSYFDDDSSAVDSYRRGVELGDAESLAQLGMRYQEGRGVPQDERVALKYLESVPEGSRSFSAWSTLAEIYLDALEPDLRDAKKALATAERAERECEGCGAGTLLAQACFENGLYERAVAEQEKAVKNITDPNDERVTTLAYYRTFVSGGVLVAQNSIQ